MENNRSTSAREHRLMSLKISENLGNIASDTFERYLQNPVKNGHPERLLLGIPIGIINGISRAVDGVLAGIADQEIDVPNGSFAETRRDAGLAKDHILPPKPLKLATDLIRLPGTLTSGFLDTLGGFEHTERLKSVQEKTRKNVKNLSLSA